MEIIAARLRALRRGRGWTQLDLAKAADLSIRTIIGLENDQIGPRSRQSAQKAFRALGYELDEAGALHRERSLSDV